MQLLPIMGAVTLLLLQVASKLCKGKVLKILKCAGLKKNKKEEDVVIGFNSNLVRVLDMMNILYLMLVTNVLDVFDCEAGQEGRAMRYVFF